jgi:hypothetical protein
MGMWALDAAIYFGLRKFSARNTKFSSYMLEILFIQMHICLNPLKGIFSDKLLIIVKILAFSLHNFSIPKKRDHGRF